MSNCKTCIHAVFDSHLGEYKCEVKQHRLYDYPDDCEDYDEGKPRLGNERKELV